MSSIGYAIYYFSGAKKAVDEFRAFKASVRDATETFKKNAAKQTDEVISRLGALVRMSFPLRSGFLTREFCMF